MDYLSQVSGLTFVSNVKPEVIKITYFIANHNHFLNQSASTYVICLN